MFCTMVVSMCIYALLKDHLHVSESQRTGRGEGDEAREICEHAKADALGSDCCWEDLCAPDERGCIDELEENDEQEDTSDGGGESCLVSTSQILPLKDSFNEQVEGKDRKSNHCTL